MGESRGSSERLLRCEAKPEHANCTGSLYECSPPTPTPGLISRKQHKLRSLHAHCSHLALQQQEQQVLGVAESAAQRAARANVHLRSEAAVGAVPGKGSDARHVQDIYCH